jgi:hypothetical protein
LRRTRHQRDEVHHTAKRTPEPHLRDQHLRGDRSSQIGVRAFVSPHVSFFTPVQRVIVVE